MKQLTIALLAVFIVTACSTPKPTVAPNPQVMDEGIDFRGESFRASPPEAGPAPTIELGDFQDFQLDNGLQVVLVENHKLPRVSYQLFIDVPPMLEGDYAGTSQMMGDMLRRATSTKTKEEIDEAIDFIGASLNTGGSGASGATISKYKETLLSMMAEVVLDARFPEEEFAKVKSEAEANLQSQLGNPGAIASRVQSVLTYGADHPYGELVTEESLANITLAQVKDYYQTYFVPNRSYLVMVGDLTRAEAESLAKKYFSDWKAGQVATPSFTMPERPDGVTVNFVPRSGSVQSNIIISHPVDVKPGTEKAIKASIVNNILGSGFGGRLFQNLREDKGYTYGANSSVSSSPVVGSFSAFADVRNEVTDSAVTQFLLELNKISQEPVTDKELSRTKSQIAGSFGRALENPRQIASYALSTVRYGLDRNYYPDYLKKVEGINQADLLEVAREVINPAKTNIIVVGDKAVADKLAKFATSGTVNYFDVNGQPVDMEDMAAPADLTAESVLMKYVDAIGGKDAIDKINNFSMVMEASVQGQTMSQTIVKEGGNKLSSQTSMMGMVMSDQRYNDGKAKLVAQGQEVPENPAITAALKSQATLFPVVDLLNKLDAVSVAGTEKIDGTDVVVLDVKTPEGSSQHYFDLATGLQVRMVQAQMGQRVTTELSDYRELSGVKFRYSMKLVGLAPFPIEMKVTKAEANATLDPDLFKID